jgi:hypothetical protein
LVLPEAEEAVPAMLIRLPETLRALAYLFLADATDGELAVSMEKPKG